VGYHRRVDKVICKKFESITTSRGGLGHWAERIGSTSWISGEWTTTSRLASGSASPHTSSVTPGLLSPPARLLLL
jgi:hypothetical protein